MTKKDEKEINPVSLNALAISIGAIVMLVCGFVAGDIHYHPINGASWLSILYLGIPGTVVTFVVYYYLLKTTGAVLMSYVAIITPLVAVTLGAILLGERFTKYTWLVAATIILGVWIAIRTPRNEQPAIQRV